MSTAAVVERNQFLPPPPTIMARDHRPNTAVWQQAPAWQVPPMRMSPRTSNGLSIIVPECGNRPYFHHQPPQTQHYHYHHHHHHSNHHHQQHHFSPPCYGSSRSQQSLSSYEQPFIHTIPLSASEESMSAPTEPEASYASSPKIRSILKRHSRYTTNNMRIPSSFSSPLENQAILSSFEPITRTTTKKRKNGFDNDDDHHYKRSNIIIASGSPPPRQRKKKRRRCVSIGFGDILTTTDSSSNSDDNNYYYEKTIRFHPGIVSDTMCIPSRHSYTQYERYTMWNSIKEIAMNAKRNSIEYKYDGWNFRKATEESDMKIDPRTGRYVHPVHLYLLRLWEQRQQQQEQQKQQQQQQVHA